MSKIERAWSKDARNIKLDEGMWNDHEKWDLQHHMVALARKMHVPSERNEGKGYHKEWGLQRRTATRPES